MWCHVQQLEAFLATRILALTDIFAFKPALDLLKPEIFAVRLSTFLQFWGVFPFLLLVMASNLIGMASNLLASCYYIVSKLKLFPFPQDPILVPQKFTRHSPHLETSLFLSQLAGRLPPSIVFPSDSPEWVVCTAPSHGWRRRSTNARCGAGTSPPHE